ATASFSSSLATTSSRAPRSTRSRSPSSSSTARARRRGPPSCARPAVRFGRRPTMTEPTTYPTVPDKWRDPSLHGPEQFLGGALAAGWDPGESPGAAIFVFDHGLRADVEQRPDAVPAPELAPGNARVYRLGRVIVSCLSPGAAAMVTQMQNLAYLGTRQFAIVGAAGSISADVCPGAT